LFCLCATIAPFSLAQSSQSSSLSVDFDQTGIRRLTYNGITLHDGKTDPSGGFAIGAIDRTRDGKTELQYHDQITGKTAWDAADQTLTYALDWGLVAVKYATTRDRVAITITIANTSPADTINGLDLFPLALHFPRRPANYDGGPVMTFGTEQPGVVTADFGDGTLAIVNEDIAQPLYCGLMVDNDTPTTNLYHWWIGSTPLNSQPTSWPLIHRPLAPGATQTLHFSLRFGPTYATARDLAPDVLDNYAAANPYSVNWPDRRPIGILFPAGSGADQRSPTNPRGWFADKNLDITTPAGQDVFARRLLAYAERSVTVLKDMNAQAVITWDIEGEQYPAATYVGDPRLAAQFAPELTHDNVIDRYFEIFRRAGFKVGVTVRPQRIVYINGKPEQRNVTNLDEQARMMADKIAYAEQHWGCSVFYLDSTDAKDGPSIVELHKLCPDVLLIPEGSSPMMYSSSAPFMSVRQGQSSTSEKIWQVYPKAFNVIDASVGDAAAVKSKLIDAVRAGDVLFFAGWFNSPSNAITKAIYQEAAKPAKP
jgi:hypothetical protein